MTKDNPLVIVQDSTNGKTSITIEGMISFVLPEKIADQMARQILFKETK